MAFDANGRFIPQITQTAAPVTATRAVAPATQLAATRAIQPTASYATPLTATRAAFATANPAYQTALARSPALTNYHVLPYLGPSTWGGPQPVAAPSAAPNTRTVNGNTLTGAAPAPNQMAAPGGAAAQQAAPTQMAHPQNWMPMMPQQSQFGQAQGMAPPTYMPSLEQAVGQNQNPQSVQNYLQALRLIGAGGNNVMMNAPGQQGAMAQGGFQGFGVNGQQAYANPVMAGAAGGQQLGYQRNMASGGGQYNVGNAAYQGSYGQAGTPWAIQGAVAPGGTGGVQGQPQWQTPQAWANPEDPGQSQAAWNALSDDQKAAYLGVGSTPMPTWDTQQGSFYSTSDIAAKTNVRPADKDLEEFLNALGVYKYEYKDKKYGEGERISPMAQEIEKTQLGASAISTNPEGYKQVDYGKLAGTQLAALALLNHKYNALEAKLKQAISTNLKNRKK